MEILFIAACVTLYVGTVLACREALWAWESRRACKHTDTAWTATPEGIRVSCSQCRAHVGTWEYAHA